MATVIEPSAMSTGDVKLTAWTSCGGCAAKWGGAPLANLVRQLAADSNAGELLVGLAPFDDAAVYQLSPDVAMVSTTDFFPPLVDDPTDFGAIAAANACSDVFAMGGRVVLALNIAAFPEELSVEAIGAILSAASATVVEAGGVVAGGHTIRSSEPIFGLAVQGVVHPDRILRKSGARPGDIVGLSKPLGTGIVLAGGTASDNAEAVKGMRTLNRAASEALQELGGVVHALTDVTGYGLLGHGFEIAERSGVTVVFDGSALPLYDGAFEASAAGVRTGGDPRNRAYLAGNITSRASETVEAIAYDPQTSGGLMCTVARDAAADLVDAGFVLIGVITEGPAGVVLEA